ncbi:hypothetical protein KJ632_06030, partial [Patescibacteria group bacterium]|nr:hypothetical protein [Patescibacteria group bacterium]
VHAEWENTSIDGYTYVKLIFNRDGIKQHYIQFTLDSLEEILDLIQTTCLKFEQFDEEKCQILCS